MRLPFGQPHSLLPVYFPVVFIFVSILKGHFREGFARVHLLLMSMNSLLCLASIVIHPLSPFFCLIPGYFRLTAALILLC